MANDYWFPWYPRHYERDAGHLDHVSNSCYRRLIDAYMEGGEPIKKDAVRLMAIMRATPQEFAMVWPQIEGFFTLQDGYLHLKRCNIELDRQDARRKFASEAGKRSAEKRSQQYQLLPNDRSTTVQRPFNDRSTTRATTGQDITGQDKTEQREESPSQSVSVEATDPLVSQCLTIYNETAEKFGWSQPKLPIANGRRVSLMARLKEAGGIDGWRVAMDKAAASGFLTGRFKRSAEHENWKPNFDFFLKQNRFRKLMEGGYDDRDGASDQQRFDAQVKQDRAEILAGAGREIRQPQRTDFTGGEGDASGSVPPVRGITRSGERG